MERFSEFLRLAWLQIIKIIVTTLLVLFSILSFKSSCFRALVLAECAYIVVCVVSMIELFRKGNSLKVGSFLKTVLPGAILFLILFAFNESDSAKLLARIIAGFMLFFLIQGECVFYEFKYQDIYDGPNEGGYVEIRDSDLLKYYDSTKLHKLVYRLSQVFSYILLLVAMVLSISDNSKFKLILCIGCLLWVIYKLSAKFYYYACDEKGLVEKRWTKNREKKNRGKKADEYSWDYSEVETSENEVYRGVQRIADRWSNKMSATSSMYQGVSLSYSATVEILGGKWIEYTLCGEVTGKKKSEAYAFARDKLNKIGYSIKSETEQYLRSLGNNVCDEYVVKFTVGNISFS